MSDVINSSGFGTLSGSLAAPSRVMTITGGKNFVTIANLDATNWVHVKADTDPGPYKVALPGTTATIAIGPPSAPNVRNVIGFAQPPNGSGGGATVVIALAADKLI